MSDAASSKRYEAVTVEKSSGATYTPPSLARFIAARIIASMGQKTTKSLRILDPAVGDGSLLEAILEQLPTVPLTVVGFDTDAKALSATRKRFSDRHPHVQLELREEDFLLHAVDAYGLQGGGQLFSEQPQYFDLIIANPPYVRTQVMGSVDAQRIAKLFGLSGRVDLYQAFLVAMRLALAPDGTLGVIVSNRFMTTKGGATIREDLITKLSLIEIWDMGDTRMFDAAVLPAVIIARGLGVPRPDDTSFVSIYETDAVPHHIAEDALTALTHEGVVQISDGRTYEVKHGVLDATQGVWRLANQSSDQWLDTVARHTERTFGDVGKVRVGVKTTADKVFIGRDWEKIPEAERPELLRPLTTHHIASRFAASDAGNRPYQIVYTHEVHNGRRKAVDLKAYPLTERYLERHRETLSSRTYVIEAGRQWYEIWVPQDPSAWSKTKLVFRDISEKPTFWVDKSGSIVNGDCYWLIPDDGNEDSVYLAAAVANSSFIEQFYDHSFNNKLYAGRRRFISQYVEKFPLPAMELDVTKRIIMLSRSLVDGSADDAELTAVEVDRLVWDAFDLTFEKG